MSDTASFLKMIKHPVKFRVFLFFQLPSAFFSGVRVRELTTDSCVTSVPFKWLTQNPFRSTYFASLAMAAEMSTGVLALANIYKRVPPVSMLVTKLEAVYFKKAVGRTYFTCEDGSAIREAIESSRQTGAAQTVRARSIGKNEAGEEVAEFFITWSFRVRAGVKTGAGLGAGA